MGSKRGKLNTEGDLRVALFVSRNKDNKGLDRYKQRRVAYITKRTDDQIKEKFKPFVESGVEGELSRCYVSVNARDEGKVKQELLIELISNETELTTLDSKLASLAANKKCAKESKWMFDYDGDLEKVDEFVEDIKKYALVKYNKSKELTPIEVVKHKTPNGYAVIVSRGFDTRGLLSKWKDVELKRDDLLCLFWDTKKD